VLPPANKLVSQVNMKVGSGYNANATGFSLHHLRLTALAVDQTLKAGVNQPGWLL